MAEGGRGKIKNNEYAKNFSKYLDIGINFCDQVRDLKVKGRPWSLVTYLKQAISDNHKMLELHKNFRRELSGKSRNTPKFNADILNNEEALDLNWVVGQFMNLKNRNNLSNVSKTPTRFHKEAGFNLWHEWPSEEVIGGFGSDKVKEDNYLGMCARYQQNWSILYQRLNF